MDIIINGSGSLYTIMPQTNFGFEWVEENVQIADYESPKIFHVEHRYIEDITTGMLAHGLKVSLNGNIVFLNENQEIVFNR